MCLFSPALFWANLLQTDNITVVNMITLFRIFPKGENVIDTVKIKDQKWWLKESKRAFWILLIYMIMWPSVSSSRRSRQFKSGIVVWTRSWNKSWNLLFNYFTQCLCLQEMEVKHCKSEGLKNSKVGKCWRVFQCLRHKQIDGWKCEGNCKKVLTGMYCQICF